MNCPNCKQEIPASKVTTRTDSCSQEIAIQVSCSCGEAWFGFINFDELAEDKPF